MNLLVKPLEFRYLLLESIIWFELLPFLPPPFFSISYWVICWALGKNILMLCGFWAILPSCFSGLLYFLLVLLIIHIERMGRILWYDVLLHSRPFSFYLSFNAVKQVTPLFFSAPTLFDFCWIFLYSERDHYLELMHNK